MRPPSDEDIVISGISGRYPKSASLQEFWENLTNGTEMYTEESKRWTSIAGRLPKTAGFLSFHDQFDNDLFGFSDGLANFMDPQQRLLHETTFEALYDAGLDPFNIGGRRAGCFVGSCYNDTNYARVSEQAPKNEKFYGRNSQFVCDTFNLKGVSLTVDTACAASFSALHQAIQAFHAGEVDFAVIGALSVQLRPQVTIGFTNLRMLSPEGKSRSLDAGVDGYCRSEAVVTIILQRRKDAKRIYSSIYHSDTNCDGYKSEGITFPSMEAQYLLMKKVYEDCGLDPERNITYVEGHMTGTPVGDPVETYAIVKALRPNKSRPLLMGCLKNMGHSEGASALCGISKVALIFQQGMIPPNINYETPNPNIPALKDGLVIPILENTPFDEDFLSVNAFGFGGVNVHAILKGNEKQASPKDYEIFKSKFKLPENWWTSRHLHNLNEFDKFTQKNKGNDMIRLVNLANRTVEGCEYAMDFIEKNREKINNDFLQLIEDVSFIDPATKLNHHSYMTWGPDDLTNGSDIALIQLNGTVRLQKRHIELACLDFGFDKTDKNESLLVTGYGAINESTPLTTSDVPRYAYFNESIISENNRTILAKAMQSSVTVCDGDYGAPIHLTSATTGLSKVIGIASYNTGPPNQDSVYCTDLVHFTKLSNFKEFIEQNIGKNHC